MEQSLLGFWALRPWVSACRFAKRNVWYNMPVNMNEYDLFHWIDAIQTGGEPLILPEQQAVVVRVIEGIYESAKTGKVVYFD